MNGFSSFHISSRGLKYALAPSAFGQGEVEEADYKKALLNVLTAQDFDISMDDHVSIYVDMSTHDVILSTSGNLGADDPLSQLINFTDPDDSTFH